MSVGTEITQNFKLLYTVLLYRHVTSGNKCAGLKRSIFYILGSGASYSPIQCYAGIKNDTKKHMFRNKEV